ncbi:MAG TPA: gliding motility-associated C-terminal domain-containing protein [Ohtaekwangia sp.]|nr:gliding motility-associated C-terminal domain-containing protein [Ohtaekwangia sp.]
MILSWEIDAQLLDNQTNVYFDEELTVYVDGDVSNSGFIQNHGNINLTGNWRNTNVYQGAGTLTLEGRAAQNVNNNKNAVHRLVVNSRGPVVIEGRLPITNRLELLSGIIHVTANDTLQMAEAAVITSGSEISHINGALFAAGAGYKYFPIGKNGRYHPVELLNINGITPLTSVEVFENVPNLVLPSPVTGFSDVYWVRKTIRGTFINSPVSIGYEIPDDYTNRHQIDILQSTALNTPFSILGNTTVAYNNGLDKIVGENALTGEVFTIGESIPIGGIPGEFYLSTSLAPDAASPDNRFVRVFGNKLSADAFQFFVYNRWGLVVFESSDLQEMISKGWDGRHKGNGDLLPSGTYPYILKAIASDGKVVEKKGIITVVN